MKLPGRIVDWLALPYGMVLLIKNPTVPVAAKVKAGLLMGALFFYFLNPADVIPDPIPVLGWLEDLLAIPLAMFVTRKAIPEVSVPEIVGKARSDTRRVFVWTAAVIIGLVLFNLAALALLVFLAIKYWF